MLIIFITIFFIKTDYSFFKNETSLTKIEKTDELQLLKENDKQIKPWGVQSLGIKEKNNSNLEKKVKVAILDSGINKNHEDLKGKVVKEYNAIRPNETVVDNYGHGTAVAGVLAANDNNIGILGVAPFVEIYSVKVLGDNGRGNIDSLVDGIKWCISNDVQIINISFGITMGNKELRSVINEAIESGIVVVASAGNTYGGNVEYPARYEDVISVTAVDSNYKVAKFSPKGKIDFAAPGVDVLTTTKDGSYSVHSGTSLAAAHVTGVISWIIANEERYNLQVNDPKLIKKIRGILKKYSIDLGDPNYYGNGFIKLN
jgi:subtilisin family serine protease